MDFAQKKYSSNANNPKCVQTCPLANRYASDTPCPVHFFEYAWEKVEAPKLERIVERKQAQLKKFQAIPTHKLIDWQHRQIKQLTEEINTLIGTIRHLNDIRDFYLKETARLGSLYQKLSTENQWLREELKKSESSLDFMLQQAQRIVRQHLDHV